MKGKEKMEIMKALDLEKKAKHILDVDTNITYEGVDYPTYIGTALDDNKKPIWHNVVVLDPNDTRKFVFAYSAEIIEGHMKVPEVSMDPFIVSIEFAKFIRQACGLTFFNLDYMHTPYACRAFAPTDGAKSLEDWRFTSYIHTVSGKEFTCGMYNTTIPQFTDDMLNLLSYDGRVDFIKDYLTKNNPYEKNRVKEDFRVNLLHCIKPEHNKDQIFQILEGIKHGLTKGKIQEYTWSKLSAKQMEQVRLGAEHGLSTRQLRRYSTHLGLSAKDMEEIRLELEKDPKADIYENFLRRKGIIK